MNNAKMPGPTIISAPPDINVNPQAAPVTSFSDIQIPANIIQATIMHSI